MIRIAVVVGKMNPGGKKSLIMEYLHHIDKSKFQFDFICDADTIDMPVKEIQELQGRVFIIPPYQNIFRNMFEMYRICRKNDYQIMHAYNSTMNIFPMFVAWLSGIPVRISESISMAHSGDWKTVLKVILKPMSKWFANCYMACGSDCGRWQFGEGAFRAGKVDVFKSIIDTRKNDYDAGLREKTRKLHGWEKNIVIGHIARFIEQKNSLRVIEIFAAIAKKESRAVMCLIGDGALKNAMFKRAEELGIRDKIAYLGRREDIQQFYNAMDAFILPSLYEGLPIVGLEAACSGLPVILSTEITQEVKISNLSEFVELSQSDSEWADVVLLAINRNWYNRRSHRLELQKMGFDVIIEAKRLEKYYGEKLKMFSRNHYD